MQNYFPQNAAMELHERIKLARERRFQTAKEASDYLRIPYGTLTGHESGSRGVKDRELRKYAGAYRVELAWLRYETGPMTNPSVSDQEMEIIEAFRKLPPEEAAAYRTVLLSRSERR